jgi:pilus assembly protein Flp/PilA
MKTLFQRFLRDQSGATAIEYGLIAALISVAAIGAMTAVGGGVSNTFTKAKDALPG